ncbi:transcription initiation factor TFIID subunit 5 [Pancytospora epiphaga]|nr:transcription initiation factor TFIID subunit 5 [Pancytospora epiphaga]
MDTEKQNCKQGNMEEAYLKLKYWIEDSLDLFKNDLLPLLYPIYLHIYFDLINSEETGTAKRFFAAYKEDFPDKIEELKIFESINSQQHLYENSLIVGFRTSKYFLVMGRYAYDLLINFLEENNIIYVLKIINQYMEIKAQSGPKSDDQKMGVDAYVENCPVDLNTAIVSTECEESILAAEQYRYDHLETYVLQLKKQRESKKVSVKVKPSPSQIEAEIEKLKDLCKRASLNKLYLPSICCYTAMNTYENLTCTDISPDVSLLACGYSSSYIDIHSLSKTPLRQLKGSVELSKIDLKGKEEKFDEVGDVKRLVGHSGPVFSVKFSTSGKFLISASQDCTIRLWSLDLFKTIAVYKAHAFPIWTVDFAPNDFYFASGGADRQAIIWSTQCTRPERFFVSSLSDVTVVKFHPNSNYLFIGSSDHKIRMHDIESAKMVRTFCGHTDTVTALDVSHCGKFLVSGSKDRNVILWDIETSRVLVKYTGHSATVYSVSFSFFGTIISSSAADNSVRLWDKTDTTGSSVGVYYTKNTPIFCARFAYRNILSCVGPFVG